MHVESNFAFNLNQYRESSRVLLALSLQSVVGRLKITCDRRQIIFGGEKKLNGNSAASISRLSHGRPDSRLRFYWIKCGCNGFYDIKSYPAPMCNSVRDRKTWRSGISLGDETGKFSTKGRASWIQMAMSIREGAKATDQKEISRWVFGASLPFRPDKQQTIRALSFVASMCDFRRANNEPQN